MGGGRVGPSLWPHRTCLSKIDPFNPSEHPPCEPFVGFGFWLVSFHRSFTLATFSTPAGFHFLYAFSLFLPKIAKFSSFHPVSLCRIPLDSCLIIVAVLIEISQKLKFSSSQEKILQIYEELSFYRKFTFGPSSTGPTLLFPEILPPRPSHPFSPVS